MTTYGNGDMCSRLLYRAVNEAYLERVASYYSYHKQCARSNKAVAAYVRKDGTFIKAFPPLGDTIREAYDEACTSVNNAWGISDYE